MSVRIGYFEIAARSYFSFAIKNNFNRQLTVRKGEGNEKECSKKRVLLPMEVVILFSPTWVQL